LIELAQVKFPKSSEGISPYALDFLRKLLEKDPTKRLGFNGGLNEIGMHPFFSTIDFDLISQKKVNKKKFK
jgi:serine/threonine protein kinase